jgi:hypothetical protein
LDKQVLKNIDMEIGKQRRRVGLRKFLNLKIPGTCILCVLPSYETGLPFAQSNSMDFHGM